MFEHGLIVMSNGRRVNVRCLEKDDIDIVSIAHALSMKCRFNGHTSEFYSVAQHCLLTEEVYDHAYGLVEDMVDGDLTEKVMLEIRLAALLHDSQEAFLPDIPSPIMREFTFMGGSMAEREEDILYYIHWALRLPFGTKYIKPIHWMDMTAMMTEAQQLLPTIEGFPDILPLNKIISCMSPEVAKECFLHRYRFLATKYHIICILEEMWEEYTDESKTRKRPPTLDPVAREVMVRMNESEPFSRVRRRVQGILHDEESFISFKEKDNCGISWKTYVHVESRYKEKAEQSKNRVENIR